MSANIENYRKRIGRLVRDKIPEYLKGVEGHSIKVKEIEQENMLKVLKAEILLIAQELLETDDIMDTYSYLADIVELLSAMAMCSQVSWPKMMEAAEIKNLNQGGYKKMYLIVGPKDEVTL